MTNWKGGKERIRVANTIPKNTEFPSEFHEPTDGSCNNTDGR
jgi:hypothetical protein